MLQLLFMNKDYKLGLEILTSFEATIKENKEDLKPHEKSELILFKARLCDKLENYIQGIDILERNKAKIVDQISCNELMSRFYMKVGNNKDKAVDHLEALL